MTVGESDHPPGSSGDSGKESPGHSGLREEPISTVIPSADPTSADVISHGAHSESVTDPAPQFHPGESGERKPASEARVQGHPATSQDLPSNHSRPHDLPSNHSRPHDLPSSHGRRHDLPSSHGRPVSQGGPLPSPMRSTSQVGLAQVTLPKSAAKRTNIMPIREVPKVSLSARGRAKGKAGTGSTFFEPVKPKKIIGWKEATQSRPPLKIDMDTPGPCTYSPKIKPLYETNAPSYTMGVLCSPEKRVIGTRTSWEKSWFQNPEVWTTKADFNNDYPWPSPGAYEQRGFTPIGNKVSTPQSGGGGTLVGRKFEAYKVEEKLETPSPNQYDKKRADRLLYHSAPASSHSLRIGGTILWGKRETTPGPADYRNVFHKTKKHSPNFSIRKTLKNDIAINLGPFATF